MTSLEMASWSASRSRFDERPVLAGIIEAGDPRGSLATTLHRRRNAEDILPARGRADHGDADQVFVAGETDAQQSSLAARIAVPVEHLRAGPAQERLIADPLEQHAAPLGVRLTQHFLNRDRLRMK